MEFVGGQGKDFILFCVRGLVGVNAVMQIMKIITFWSLNPGDAWSTDNCSKFYRQ